MMNQTRRGLLGAIGISPIAGCFNRDEDQEERQANSGLRIVGYKVIDWYGAPDESFHPRDAPVARYLATKKAAEGFVGEGSRSVSRFVDELNFEDGDRLLYVATFGPQTCYTLDIGADPYVDDDDGVPNVSFRTVRTAPSDQACGDAVTPVHVLARLSFDRDVSDVETVKVEAPAPLGERETLTVTAED